MTRLNDKASMQFEKQIFHSENQTFKDIRLANFITIGNIN